MHDDEFKVDFIGIGVAKSGTTWIHQCLEEHPGICVSVPKETRFFSHDYDKGVEYYKKYFKHYRKGQIRGAYTPTYFHKELVAKRIKSCFPNVKLIVCMRNPVERAISEYTFAYLFGRYHGDIEEKIKRDLVRYKQHDEDIVLKRGFYWQHLQKWLELFPREQILILFNEDIKKDPLSFIKTVFRFLKVDDSYIPASLERKVNVTATNYIRSYWINRFLLWVDNMLVWMRKTMKSIFYTDNVKKLLKPIDVKLEGFVQKLFLFNTRDYRDENLKPVKKPEISKSTLRALREFYREDVQKLEKFVNRDLSFWYE